MIDTDLDAHRVYCCSIVEDWAEVKRSRTYTSPTINCVDLTLEVKDDDDGKRHELMVKLTPEDAEALAMALVLRAQEVRANPEVVLS